MFLKLCFRAQGCYTVTRIPCPSAILVECEGLGKIIVGGMHYEGDQGKSDIVVCDLSSITLGTLVRLLSSHMKIHPTAMQIVTQTGISLFEGTKMNNLVRIFLLSIF